MTDIQIETQYSTGASRRDIEGAFAAAGNAEQPSRPAEPGRAAPAGI